MFNIDKSYNENNEIINVELIEKPILQINDKNNNLTYIVSESAIVKNFYNDIILNNVDIYNNFISGKSNIIIFNNEKNEILMKNRPELIFYNNK